MALREAQVAFEAWAGYCVSTVLAPTRDLTLTPAERQVAEFAASGMTNRDIAAVLFISRKTYEANLPRLRPARSRSYRLGRCTAWLIVPG